MWPRCAIPTRSPSATTGSTASPRYRALLSAGVILAVLLAFLRSFRAAAVVFATIVFSILAALNVIYLAGFTLNVLTLMGLAMAFGQVDDNAIVVLENIHRKNAAGAAGAREAAEAGGP